MTAVTYSHSTAMPHSVVTRRVVMRRVVTHAAPVGQATPAAPRLRLTRRGRTVLGALVAVPLAIAAVVLGIGAGGALATQDAGEASYTWVTVDAGQSLWDLAAELAPSEDPREFAAQVASLNQLRSSVVQPGQELAIPAAYTD